ncbi:MAG: DNA-binding domain-containing protein [Pirellulaceae bacterium]
MSDRKLRELQNWLQAVITHPGGVKAGLLSDEARQAVPVSLEQLESVVERSLACTSVERLSVYAGAYYARLLSCLRDSFPTLVIALDEDLFDRFAFGYLQRYPSRSYTLGRLADRFLAYLEETRPTSIDDGSRDDLEFARWQQFVIDLARLEWTIDQVFDGPGNESDPPLSAQAMSNLSPEAWQQARLQTAPCLRLLSFRFPVNDYFTAVREGEHPPRPEPEETFLALTRRDYIVRRHPLSRPQFVLLDALAERRTIGESIALAAHECDDLERLAADLQSWFANWTAAGFFQRITS